MDAPTLSALLPPGSLFAACRADELADMLALASQQTMKKGQTVLLQGDPGDALIILLKGQARVTMVASNGREITLDYADPGGVLGEIAVLDGGERGQRRLSRSATVHISASAARLLKPLWNGNPAWLGA
jgi:CRP/FNR family transcriptional regulator, cyclic AMP receptor protein